MLGLPAMQGNPTAVLLGGKGCPGTETKVQAGCPGGTALGRGVGEVLGARQVLAQLLSRGDRWDKRAWALQGPVN